MIFITPILTLRKAENVKKFEDYFAETGLNELCSSRKLFITKQSEGSLRRDVWFRFVLLNPHMRSIPAGLESNWQLCFNFSLIKHILDFVSCFVLIAFFQNSSNKAKVIFEDEILTVSSLVLKKFQNFSCNKFLFKFESSHCSQGGGLYKD